MRVLYLSYTGLAEPLGQSQVLAYLKGLARNHAITLVTVEKPADLANAPAIAALRAQCEAAGIRWRPLRYHRRPRLLATAWDLLALMRTALGEARRTDLIHARSYIPAFAALLVGALTAKPFVFDMRALWPEEMIAAGRLREGSLIHRLIKAGERICLARAAGVVSLTHAAVRHLQAEHGAALVHQHFEVIPTCVDLSRFTPAPRPPVLTVGSVGTVLSGWFRTGWLMAFFRAAAAPRPDARLKIVTRDNAQRLRQEADGIAPARLEIFGVDPVEVPGAISQLSAAAMFFESGLAKLGSCPTRMGEVLACGLPVVANPGVGDVAEIIERYRAGVLVRENTPAAMDAAVGELLALLQDVGLPARCRQAAEEWFSLEGGIAAYERVYALAGRR
jgi:glycosyltransferase involved in cell wall biosynthesis